jgi:hypothetical protein
MAKLIKTDQQVRAKASLGLHPCPQLSGRFVVSSPQGDGQCSPGPYSRMGVLDRSLSL